MFSTVIVYAHRNGSLARKRVPGMVGLPVTVRAALRAAVPVARVTGTFGLDIASRNMGLVLTAIAVGFTTTGPGVLLAGLSHWRPACCIRHGQSVQVR
jgi:small neutral amino acid transporter SnatA (MarC family)